MKIKSLLLIVLISFVSFNVMAQRKSYNSYCFDVYYNGMKKYNPRDWAVFMDFSESNPQFAAVNMAAHYNDDDVDLIVNLKTTKDRRNEATYTLVSFYGVDQYGSKVVFEIKTDRAEAVGGPNNVKIVYTIYENGVIQHKFSTRIRDRIE